MKATVWTRPNYNQSVEARAKCIWQGEITAIPNETTGLVVRDGFCVESIRHVYYDLTTGEVEIGLNTTDPNEEYGPSLI